MVRLTQHRVLRNHLALLLAACSALATRSANAQQAPPAHPRVPAFERFFAEQTDGREGGLLLLGELNCVACHQAEAAVASQLHAKQAPILDKVGERVRPEFLREYLTNPHQAKPGATMPHLLTDGSEAERAEQVEALVHFLATGGQLTESAPARQSVTRGEQLYHSVGCAACHDPQGEQARSLRNSVPLPKLETKYTIPSLAQFLQEPLVVRPSGRMPHLNLTPEEARDVASYLLRELEVEPNVAYEYYEGSWDNLPDFDQLTPKATGKCTGFDILVGDRRDQFAVRFTAPIDIPRDGDYQFHLGSDDGSRLLIDGRVVVTNDGVHPHSVKSGRVKLTRGVHELRLEYFEQGGEESLQLEVEGPRMRRQSAEALLVTSAESAPDSKPRFVADPSLAEKGKQLFTSIGCASCHQASGVPRGTAPGQATAQSLAAMKNAGGCLDERPRQGLPNYALNGRQRASLTAAIAHLQSAPSPPTAAEAIHHTLTTFNCYACHQRGEIGGVERPREALFKSDQQEMGDEGRIPPHLTGVGAKDRPYMFTRMPRFGMDNVGGLVAALEEVDRPLLADVKVPETDIAERRMKSAGRQLTGSAGYSCIKCHTFGNAKATGIQSINMTTMTERLRPEWFQQYMLNPQAWRPGTRMPAAWPDGQVLLPNVLDGTAETQIRSIWEYLSDGGKASPPAGLGGEPEELYVIDEAVIYRNFIDGAGPRAIAVGYPERVNLAFDANNLNLALLWHNAFIDAGRHWSGRGQGFQPPLGDNVLRLAAAAPLARLENDDAAWPSGSPREQGYRFRGYRLGSQQRPTFLYSLDEIQIEDEPTPVSSEPFAPLRRRLSLTSEKPVESLVYRAVVADRIEPAADGWFTINGSWKTRVESASSPRVRTVGGKAELLVPVAWNNGTATIVQEYDW